MKDNNGSGNADAAHNLTTCVNNEATFMFHLIYVGEHLLNVFCEVETYDASSSPCENRVS